MSFDSPEDNRAFAEKFEFPYALLSDEDRVLALAYGACESPQDGYAKRVGVVLNADGSVLKYYPQASANSFALDVLKDLGLKEEKS